MTSNTTCEAECLSSYQENGRKQREVGEEISLYEASATPRVGVSKDIEERAGRRQSGVPVLISQLG